MLSQRADSAEKNARLAPEPVQCREGSGVPRLAVRKGMEEVK